MINSSWQTIHGRNNASGPERPLIYRAKIPIEWVQRDPPPDGSLVDTRKPLVEYFIQDNNQSIRITLHNFPSNSVEERIPPLSQVNRWKRQFDIIFPESVIISPVANGGFSGLFFEASGTLDNIKTTILGWSMQLAAEHYRTLSNYEGDIYLQIRSDYTLKAVGPTDLVIKHKNNIIDFFNSFELIEEIPSSI
jgi:hypothetical protein